MPRTHSTVECTPPSPRSYAASINASLEIGCGQKALQAHEHVAHQRLGTVVALRTVHDVAVLVTGQRHPLTASNGGGTVVRIAAGDVINDGACGETQ